MGGCDAAEIELDLTRGGGRGTAQGLRAEPASGHGRAVLVIGQGEALGGFERDVCERLARAGFLALAPALGGPDLDPETVLATGVLRLLDDASTDGARVAALGFGAGGTLALRLAAANSRVGAAVDFDGLPDDSDLAAMAGCTKPALLAFGANDPRLADGRGAAITERLPGARLHLAPGAGEGFMDAERADRHVAGAAAAGWDAALAFLGAVL